MALVRMLRGGQVTLPAEARKALNTFRRRLSRPRSVRWRRNPQAGYGRRPRRKPIGSSTRILSRVKYIGPEPAPTEDEIMDLAADEVRAVRAKHASSRPR